MTRHTIFSTAISARGGCSHRLPDRLRLTDATAPTVLGTADTAYTWTAPSTGMHRRRRWCCTTASGTNGRQMSLIVGARWPTLQTVALDNLGYGLTGSHRGPCRRMTIGSIWWWTLAYERARDDRPSS